MPGMPRSILSWRDLSPVLRCLIAEVTSAGILRFSAGDVAYAIAYFAGLKSFSTIIAYVLHTGVFEIGMLPNCVLLSVHFTAISLQPRTFCWSIA